MESGTQKREKNFRKMERQKKRGDDLGEMQKKGDDAGTITHTLHRKREKGKISLTTLGGAGERGLARCR